MAFFFEFSFRAHLIFAKFHIEMSSRKKGKEMIVKNLKGTWLKRSLLDVFSDGFSSFRDGMSGQLTGEDELDSGLDLSG